MLIRLEKKKKQNEIKNHRKYSFGPAPSVIRNKNRLMTDKLTINYFTRPFHTYKFLCVYPDINSEYDAINSEDIGEGSKKDKSRVINDKLVDNKKQGLEVRDDLRNHTKIIDKFCKIRSSDAKNTSEEFEKFAYNEEEKVTKIHDRAYSATNNEKYEDGINESAMNKAIFSISKSEYSAQVLGINLSTEEVETNTAAKGLVKDLYQIRENRFKLQEFQKENDNQPSLIDDYADVSTEMPDYVGGED